MKPDSLLFRTLEFYGTRFNHRGQWIVHEKLRNMLGATVDADLEVTRGGLRWILNPADFMQSELFWLGQQDSWDMLHIKRLLGPGAVIFDVGANFGYYSIVLAAALNRECHVHAFEPHPVTHERLLRNIELNDLGSCITVHRLGLSDVEGVGRMVERDGNSGAASVELTMDGGDAPLTTLDRFCSERELDRLDFLKIDIEGFEERMLLGAAETLKRLRPLIVIELNPSTLVRERSSVERISGLLREHGYSLYASRRERLLPLERLPEGLEIVNAFCFPKGMEVSES